MWKMNMALQNAEQKVVIVGAGQAGGRAAEALRAAGHKGDIVLVGRETHPPYERPPLSKELLNGSMTVEGTYIRPLSFYEEAGISLRLGTSVAAIDPAEKRLNFADGTSTAYDLLLLTTGARARKLPIPGGEGPRIFYLRDIDDCMALRERLSTGVRLLVIGAGFIGLEVAASARKLGAEVTVLEAGQHVMGRILPSEIGCYFADLHRRNGVDLRLGVAVTAFKEFTGGVRGLTRNCGEFVADIVAVGIGAVPNAELAAAAGLTVDDGVVVDEQGRTSDSAIFAAGDLTRHYNPLLGRSLRLETWANAQNQAIAVAKVMAGLPETYTEIPWLWSDQFDTNLQMAGAPANWLNMVWRGTPSDAAFTLFALDRGRPVGAVTINNAREMRFARKLIARGREVDPVVLGNTDINLQDLCR